MNAPLNEEHYKDSLLFPRPDEASAFSLKARTGRSRTILPGEDSSGLAYFDHRFTELKQLLARKDEGKREIEHIKSSLGQILARLEQLADEMPNGKTLELVEAKLGTLSDRSMRCGAKRPGREPYFAGRGGNPRRHRPDTGSTGEI